MPIFKDRSKEILFIHIPKTGGTTIERWLGASMNMYFHTVGKPSAMKITPQHMTIEDMILLFGGYQWDYSFAIVRDPYERIISEYFYRTQMAVELYGERPNFSRWVIENLNQYRKNTFVLDNHLRPQYHFVNDKVEIYRFESGLDQIVKKLSSEIGTQPPSKLSRHNASERKEVIFSNEALEAVNEIYKNDFDYFGYAMRHNKVKMS
jgi:hypothetical protein